MNYSVTMIVMCCNNFAVFTQSESLSLIVSLCGGLCVYQGRCSSVIYCTCMDIFLTNFCQTYILKRRLI